MLNPDGWRRVSLLWGSEVWPNESDEVKDSFEKHIESDEVTTFADLTPAEQNLIRRGELAVHVGRSKFQNPSFWGDAAAIDDALDSGNLDDLDAALATIGERDGSGPNKDHLRDGTPITPDHVGEDLADEDEEEVEYDLEGKDWVGL